MSAMPRSRRAASKEAIKQLQRISSTAYADDDEDDPDVQIEVLDYPTLEVSDDDDEDTGKSSKQTAAVVSPPKKKPKLIMKKTVEPIPVKPKRAMLVLKTVEKINASASSLINVPNARRVGESHSVHPTLKLEVWDDDLEPVQLETHARIEREIREVDNCVAQLRKGETRRIYQSENVNSFEITAQPCQPPPMATPSLVLSNGAAQNYQFVMDPRVGFIVAQPKGGAAGGGAALMKPPPPPGNKPVVKKVKANVGRPKGGSLPTIRKIQPVNTRASVGKSPGTSGTTTRQRKQTMATVATVTTTDTAIVDLTNDDLIRTIPDSREVSFNKLQGKTFPSLVVVARPHLRVKETTANDRIKLDAKVKNVLIHVPSKFTEWLIQQGMVRAEQNCTLHPYNKLKLGMYSDVSKFPFSGGYVWISECCPHRFVSVFSGSLFEGSPHPPSVILKLIYHWACQTNVQNIVQWVRVDNLYVKGMNTWLRAACTVALHTHAGILGGAGKHVEVGVISLGTTSIDGRQRQVKVEVLGILDVQTKLMRLRAIDPINDAERNYRKRFSKILEPLVQWVYRDSFIVTDVTVDKNTLTNLGFKSVYQALPNDSLNNNTIMEYLRKIVPRMFQNTLSLLSRQIIQQFLDELVWREWYGSTTAQAFDNIIAHLSTQTRSDTPSLTNYLNKVAANPFKNWNLSANTTSNTFPVDQPVTKRLSRSRKLTVTPRFAPGPTPMPSTSAAAIQAPSTSAQQQQKAAPTRAISPDVPEELVPLESYYYGSIDGELNADKYMKVWSIRCSLCKITFSNNLLLMRHLFSHAHTVAKNAHQCRYCLSSVGTADGLQRHIKTSHPAESQFGVGFACLICETKFTNSVALGKHLSKEHLPAELPYSCGTCGFRCSAHRTAIDHFYDEHNGLPAIQCPFCLKCTLLFIAGRVLTQNVNFFLQHLQKHQKKAVAKKCSRCALWFVTKETLKDHLLTMHTSQRHKEGLNAWPGSALVVPKSKWDLQDLNREIDFSKMVIRAPGMHRCRECKVSIFSSQHFTGVETCSNPNCKYVTCCKNAIKAHKDICKRLNLSLPVNQLPKAMHCVCGYKDTEGNTLAKHLAECERKSAYPSQEDATRAIKSNSMLDVLGLVRRPEEPQPAPPTVEIDDNNDKLVASRTADHAKSKGNEEETSEKPQEADKDETTTVETIEDEQMVVESIEEEKEVEKEVEKVVEEVEKEVEKMDVDAVVEADESASTPAESQQVNDNIIE